MPKKPIRFKRPYIAGPDDVAITRDNETAIIEYKESGVSGVNLGLGPKIQGMSDEEILHHHNSCIQAQLESIKNYKHVATEIPQGMPQVKYFTLGGYWTPRGDVLRCIIDRDSATKQTTICIDDKEFSMQEFGEILSTFEGWGMRIIIVPDHETHKNPPIEIKEPDDENNFLG